MAATASQIAVKIQGLREAKAAFQALEPTFRENLADATETTAREIARAAQNRLLSSPSIRTRNLYNAVGYTMNRNNGKGRAGIQNVTSMIKITLGGKTVRRRVKGIVSAGKTTDRPARRAHFVEFGTRKMRAEPFMLPAAESQKQPYLDRCRAAGKNAERDLAAIGSRGF